LEIATVEVGPRLLAHEVQEAWLQFEKYLTQQGMTAKDYLEHSKMDEEGYKKNHIEAEALRRIKAEIILGQIRKMSDVTVTSEEIEVEVEKLMSRFTAEDVKTRLREMMKVGGSQYQEIETRLKYQKIVDQFFEE